jgi:uncharacterized SAM-binding protein YcdF (DUF218 family)
MAYLDKPFKITPDYCDAIYKLFIKNNTTISKAAKYDVIIIPGNMLVMKDQIKFIDNLIRSGFIGTIVLTGGVSPIYQKLSFDTLGSILIELFKGNGVLDILKPESIRLYNRLPRSFANKFILEQKSRDTYQNAENAKQLLLEQGIKAKKIIIAAVLDHLPRSVETFKNVFGNNVSVKGIIVNPEKQLKIHCWWLRRRIASEINLMKRFSNKNDKNVKKHLVLSPATKSLIDRF